MMLEIRFTKEQFAAISLAAHFEDITLNEFVVSVLKDEADKQIEVYDSACVTEEQPS